jgi:hypothetical protein
MMTRGQYLSDLVGATYSWPNDGLNVLMMPHTDLLRMVFIAEFRC